MSVSAIAGQAAMAIQQITSLRTQFDDLQRQLSTGQKSDNYAGLGLDRGVSVSLNSQLSAISGFDNTADMVSTRINLMSTALTQMTSLTSDVKAAIAQSNTTAGSSGVTVSQQTAQSSLDTLLGLLNAQSGGRYLFSGEATDQPAVETLDHILNGDGARAGLKQLITERNQADLGASGLGRLTVGAAAGVVTVAEDAVSPFGFKLASVTSNLTNATTSGPSGSPASTTVTFTGPPNNGDTVTFRLNLPDGTSENLTLTATTNSPPGPNEFTIDPVPANTATNLQNALTASLSTLGSTALTAASAVAASNDFFNADVNNPPQRVAGSSPFYGATAMTPGTAANTVIWYTGEAGATPARDTATARVDTSLVVSYGARANESAIRTLAENVAALAAVQITPSTPNAAGLSSALNQRITANLDGAPGAQTISDIATELSVAQTAVTSAKDRHQQTTAQLSDFLQQITGVSNEQVGTKLLTLQTRMQASMQTTSMLFQLSLVNFLK